MATPVSPTNTQSETYALHDDEALIRTIPQQLVQAWNAGRGDRFAAPFSEGADFVAFEGTHLQGRSEIGAFHQRLFETALKGTRIFGEARFVRFLDTRTAVMHSVAGTTLQNADRPTPSRDSMQLFVVEKHDAPVGSQWLVRAVMNARKLTLERQAFWDNFDVLSPSQQQHVMEHVASLARDG